jgi:hypothetical protein
VHTCHKCQGTDGHFDDMRHSSYAIREEHAAEYRPNAAERLVRIARSAASHEEAVAAMQRAIEELLK